MQLIHVELRRALESVVSAERRLIEQTQQGEIANYATGNAEADDPAKTGSNWGAERTIRAEVIYALATGWNSPGPVHAKGIHVQGAKIIGPLDLSYALIKSPLLLNGCYIAEPATLEGADAPSIDFSGSCLSQGLQADNLTVHGNLDLRNVSAKGEVRLRVAKIDGQLGLRGGTLENPQGNALDAGSITVGSGLFLDQGFKAKGAVTLLGAKIEGALSCHGGNFENPAVYGVAIAKALRTLFGSGGSVGDATVYALNADRAACGAVYIGAGFTAIGEVNLLGSKIAGQLNCRGGNFENPRGTL